MSLGLSTGIAFIDTQTQGGTITLPNTAILPGRIITFKDSMRTFDVSSFTLATENQFIDGMISSIQVTRGGWTTVTADNNNWYVTGGTQLNTVTTSTMNTKNLYLDSLTISTLNVNSLTFTDSIIPSYTMTLIASTTSLYLSTPSTTLAVAGGPRQSFGTLFLQVKS